MKRAAVLILGLTLLIGSSRSKEATPSVVSQEEPPPTATIVVEGGNGTQPASAFHEDKLLAGPGSRFIVLDEPATVSAQEADWLREDELVLGIVWGGSARAYPIRQMAYHHIANDIIGGKPYLVTY